MRTLSTPLQNALAGTSYKFLLNGTLEPSRVFFDTLDDNAPGWADASGFLDSPVIQEIGVETSTPWTLVTFYNHSGTLQYQIEGSSSVVDTGVSLDGKPGVYGDHIFFMDNGTLYHRVLDWSAIKSQSSSILTGGGSIASGYATGVAYAVHGVSNTGCVVFEEDDGGFRVHYNDTSSNQFDQAGRFMFPKTVQYYDEDQGETERNMSDLVLSSGAAQLGNEIFAYISNCWFGSVDGILFSTVSEQFSDIFVAVPSELSSSMSEFRCTNAYTVGSAIYMAGQFVRKDNVSDYTPYALILRSTNGRNFSLDQNTLVSILGYRLLACVRNSNLRVTACNRTSGAQASHYFMGTINEPASQAVVIGEDSIGNFSDRSGQNASIGLKAGNHVLMFHPYMTPGSRILMNSGYKTTGGNETIRYGSYIIAGFSGAIANGERSLSPQLVNESEFNLSSMSSPFYTQIISRSSIKDDLVDLRNMYTAPNSGIGESMFAVDFWDCEAFSDTTEGITGNSPILKGGVSFWDLSGSHKIGVKTKDLDTYFDVDKFPEVTGATVHAKIYGWSEDMDGSANDYVGLVLFMESSGSAGDYSYVVDNTKQFPCTYLNTASGDFPIEYDITGIPVGDSIRAVGVYFEAAASTRAYISRVEFTSGIVMYRDTSSDNTPWDIVAGSGMEIPGTGSARIMFSSKPYNAYNFMIRSKFKCTVTGYVSSRPCGFGMVGLAEDGSNYIVARYNLATTNLEIVKVRNRVETILTSGSPGSAIGTDCEMLFSHRDGRFAIAILRNGVWEEDLSYEWQVSDGWMFTNILASMHCGIYGIIDQPYFYTTGLDVGSDDTEDINSEAIPFLPGLDPDILDEFPSSGTVVIAGNKYTYGSKNKRTTIRGPFQLRNTGDGTGGTYADPYGNGQPGLECLDLDWTASDGSYIGYVIAVSNGGSYTCSWTQWQIWNTTGGSRLDIPDRARYSSENDMIGRVYYDLSNGVYLTGGLMDPVLAEGEAGILSVGSRVELDHGGSIWCSSFAGSNGDIDVTVEDLIDRISRNCNAVAEFPGDVIESSLTYSGSDILLDTQESVSGFDVRFTFPALSDSEYVDLISDTQPREYDDATKTFIRIEKVSSGNYEVGFYVNNPDTLIDSMPFSMSDLPHSVRVLYHDNFATVYIDEFWIMTFGFSSLRNDEDPVHDIHGITYSDTVNLYLSTNHMSLSFSNVRVCELADWREAVYVDLETDGKTAISSVIQDRPVEIVYKSNGAIAYSYNLNRDTVTPDQDLISSHRWDSSYPGSAGSDAIVYFSDVRVYQDLDFAEQYGLSTKMVRLPSLDQGAMRAAKILMKKLRESGEVHTIVMRPHLAVEAGDILRILYTTVGAVKSWDCQVIIESVALTASEGANNSMEIVGRIKS